jgi:NTP pyrophosphatase (non-canonical NTP hydrolase)
MIDNTNEILSILQEECAEVIQAVSKVNRFGFLGMNPKDHRNNRQHLEEEIGDLICMIELLVENNLINQANIDSAAVNKRTKLRKWSTIFIGDNGQAINKDQHV